MKSELRGDATPDVWFSRIDQFQLSAIEPEPVLRIVRAQAGVLKRQARTAAITSDEPTPVTQANQPR